MAPESTIRAERRSSSLIEKTSAQRAVNTDKDILKVGDLYYMCFQGVWFMSKTPTGPWEVTAEVPKTIYEIPVSCRRRSPTSPWRNRTTTRSCMRRPRPSRE